MKCERWRQSVEKNTVLIFLLSYIWSCESDSWWAINMGCHKNNVICSVMHAAHDCAKMVFWGFFVSIQKPLTEINTFSKQTRSLRDNHHPPRLFLIDHLWREDEYKEENKGESVHRALTFFVICITARASMRLAPLKRWFCIVMGGVRYHSCMRCINRSSGSSVAGTTVAVLLQVVRC